MHTEQRLKIKKKSAGSAAVEFVLMMPLLLLLALPIFDLTRIIQANMILVNLSREGANLASRSSQDPQTIMNAIAQTTPPLTMATNGMIYISKIMGNAPGTQDVILAQYRWTQGASQANQTSNVWSACGSNWASDGSGQCNSIPATGTPINDAMSGTLSDGEVIYVVEVFYHVDLLFSAMNLGFGITTPQFDPDLYSKTIF